MIEHCHIQNSLGLVLKHTAFDSTTISRLKLIVD